MKAIGKMLIGPALAGAALIAGVASYSAAVAQEGADVAAAPGAGAAYGAHGPRGEERLFSKLGLSAEQQASIKSIMSAARPQMKSLHEQMQADHMKLLQMKPNDPEYANTVADVSQSEANLAQQRVKQRSLLRTQIYAVLTPAQQTQLAGLEAQWASAPHEHWGQHGPRGSIGGAAGAPPSTAVQ